MTKRGREATKEEAERLHFMEKRERGDKENTEEAVEQKRQARYEFPSRQGEVVYHFRAREEGKKEKEEEEDDRALARDMDKDTKIEAQRERHERQLVGIDERHKKYTNRGFRVEGHYNQTEGDMAHEYFRDRSRKGQDDIRRLKGKREKIFKAPSGASFKHPVTETEEFEQEAEDESELIEQMHEDSKAEREKERVALKGKNALSISDKPPRYRRFH